MEARDPREASADPSGSSGGRMALQVSRIEARGQGLYTPASTRHLDVAAPEVGWEDT